MVIEIIKGIVPFLIILCTFIIAISLCIMAIREETGDYEPYYMISYRLAYGDFEDDDMLNTESERVIFVLASVLMPLVLLNLLIAIMGDYYDQI